ncbi:antibiotic biosynthesis monooxygenase [Amycolatopsis viridis]|uniref:Quinol monooxygenase YgiN n=1 Tax=Amycolatopsis viridis TaxID=185678 RepID=A0ABX0SUH2_9PSEU|nr:antibiotic biosynthesis monooxygenase [Amycolatopsis viridis]NIH80611.1 quinol monooxygenase YgiN [Amycolatopsis viridis]
MFARSTTIQAQQDTLDAGLSHVRDETMPELMDMPGFVGLSLLIDRDSGRCIVTTSWESAEAMHDTADRVRPLRDRAMEVMGGGRPQVDEWEIAVLHRDHPAPEGACCRVTWVRFDQLDRALDSYRMGLLPELTQFGGFCSASLMIDRDSGRAVSSVTFTDRQAMDSSRSRAEELRSRITGEAGVEILEVGEFELALAHLRVPEMA